MLSPLLALMTAAAPTPTPAAPPPLYGLALVANGPSKMGLASLNLSTGSGKVIGPAHSEIFPAGDLVAVANGVLHYLGDTAQGAVLVALNVTSGEKVCSAPVALREIGYVGMGQSLDFDASSNSLILSGVAAQGPNATHAVYRAAADGTCGPFKLVGKFGDAAYIPMLHASSLDVDGQRLFVQLATGQNTVAIGVIDLNQPTGKYLTVIDEGSSPDTSLLCMHWDKQTKRLLGVAAGSDGLTMHSLDPSGAGTWEPPKSLAHVPTYWNTLGGNEGTASAFDAQSRSLVVMAGHVDQHSGAEKLELATIDVDKLAVVSHPPLASIGMKGCVDCLEGISF